MTYSNLLFASVLLPVSVLACLFDRSSEYKNFVLLITTALFAVWAKPAVVLIVFLTVVVDFFLALAADKTTKKANGIILIDALWNLAVFTFTARNAYFAADGIFHLKSTLLPIAVGFLTLKNFSYVFDVASHKIRAEKNFFCLLTYSAAYPFLLAGPVVRYGDIEPQIRNRSITATDISEGLTRFTIGFAKTVIALPIFKNIAELGLFAEKASFSGAWIGMLSFFAAGYLGFTALSDMGTGIARMNGFQTSVNYRQITANKLTGGLVKSFNTSMISLFEDVRGRSFVMTLILSVVGGYFYSGELFVLVISAIVGLVLAAENSVGYEKIEKCPKVLKIILTIASAFALFSGFAFDSFGKWSKWVLRLVGVGNARFLDRDLRSALLGGCFVIAIVIIAASPIGEKISQSLDVSPENASKYKKTRIFKTVMTSLLLILSFVMAAAKLA